MSIIIVLIFVSLIIAIGFLVAFIWSLKGGQFDDTYSPAVRMLFDAKPKSSTGNSAREPKDDLPVTHPPKKDRDIS